MAITQKLALEILNSGIFYNPASKHYHNKVNPRVVCDYCRRDNLNVCIGYKEYDLCLPCVDRLTNGPFGFTSLPDPNVMTLMMQDSVYSRHHEPRWQMPLTRMMQDSVYPRPVTAMKQDSVIRRHTVITSNVDDPLIDPTVLIGLTTSGAKAAYPKVSIRIVERDGVGLVHTDDFRIGRINVGTTQGIISKILGKF